VIPFGGESKGQMMSGRQISLAEGFLDPRMGVRGTLKRVLEVIDWTPLEALALRVRSGDWGRPGYTALALLKALYLQALYNLSDPAMEEALIDRVSFRLFCGFALDQVTPDETTLLRFRHDCVAAGVLEEAFAEVNRQFEAKGLIIRKGTLMDATIVSAASRRPTLEAGSKPSLQREPGATFTRKGGKSYFGYRFHIGADMGSGLIRRLALTPAHINESAVADALVCGDEAAVYGDKGYENKKRRARLKRSGIKDRIMHRSHKHQSGLPYWQRRRNAMIARLRSPVEAIFGTIKRLYGRTRMRYRSFSHNLADMHRIATMHNLRRAVTLSA
jgi:IS5 family transposase